MPVMDAPPRCPICDKPAAPRNRPFCGPRCAQIDLGRWLTGAYRVPATSEEEAPDEERDQVSDGDSTGRSG